MNKLSKIEIPSIIEIYSKINQNDGESLIIFENSEHLKNFLSYNGKIFKKIHGNAHLSDGKMRVVICSVLDLEEFENPFKSKFKNIVFVENVEDILKDERTRESKGNVNESYLSFIYKKRNTLFSEETKLTQIGFDYVDESTVTSRYGPNSFLSNVKIPEINVKIELQPLIRS